MSICRQGFGVLLGIGLSTSAYADKVCIADPDSKGWRCGSAEEMAQIQPRKLQRPASSSGAAPSIFLVDPDRLPQIGYQPPNPPTQAAATSGYPPGPNSSAAQSTTAQPPGGLPPTLQQRPEATPSRAAAVAVPIAASAAAAPSASSVSTDANPPTASAPAALKEPQTAPAKSTNANADADANANAAARQQEIDENIARIAALTAEQATEAAPTSQATAVPAAPTPTPRQATATPSSPVASAAQSATPVPQPVSANRTASSAPAAQAKRAPSHAPVASTPSPRKFEGWAASEYTLQLVAAGSRDGFSGFLQAFTLDSSQVHEVRLQQPDKTWWLLCYGRYDSLTAANQALQQLDPALREKGAWPRRVGPLQAEQSR